MTERDDFTVRRDPIARLAVFAGVMRLESSEACERVFGPLRSELIASSKPYTLELTDVVFMNSSGIHALASLVLIAKKAQVPLRIRSNSESPWQKKTLASLRLLDRGLEVEFDASNTSQPVHD